MNEWHVKQKTKNEELIRLSFLTATNILQAFIPIFQIVLCPINMNAVTSGSAQSLTHSLVMLRNLLKKSPKVIIAQQVPLSLS